MAGGIFISQEVILGLVFFFFFKEILMLLCIFPVFICIPTRRKGGFHFLLSPLWDLVSVDLFDTGLSEQYEVIPYGGFGCPCLGGSHV